MNSKIAIEEYRLLCRNLSALSKHTHRSKVLRSDFDEMRRETKQGEPVPRTYHDLTGPMSEMHDHIDKIFQRQIGRLIVDEQRKDVWDQQYKKSTKKKAGKK